MPQSPIISKESIELLLAWLAPTKEEGAVSYQAIHKKLVRYFGFKGCACPEELADRVFDRICFDILKLKERFQESADRSGIFLRYANYIYLEYVRERAHVILVPLSEDENKETKQNCLDSCLNEYEELDRRLLVDYYRYEPGKKIAWRNELAVKQNMSLNALRSQMCRWRMNLRECVIRCTQTAASKQVH
ncbi:MAG TPA: hypothetical protein VJN89_11365 [Candidatus Acidoferrum sp.]|nr:hypothetical protein [Candidatus Acidoferrum sp.]